MGAKGSRLCVALAVAGSVTAAVVGLWPSLAHRPKPVEAADARGGRAVVGTLAPRAGRERGGTGRVESDEERAIRRRLVLSLLAADAAHGKDPAACRGALVDAALVAGWGPPVLQLLDIWRDETFAESEAARDAARKAWRSWMDATLENLTGEAPRHSPSNGG